MTKPTDFQRGGSRELTSSQLGSIDGHIDVDITTVAPTDGQVLVWDDGAGLWVPGSVSGIPVSIIDAKGDLIVGTAADTAARKAAGANDTILMADSAQSDGLKWVGSQTPSTLDYDDIAAEGTADTYARGDHLHGMPSAGSGSVPSGTDPGDLLVWDGAAYDVLPIGASDDDVLTVDSGEALGVKWATPTGGGGGVTQSYVGYNTVGGTAETLTSRKIFAKKVTLASAGQLTGIEVYCDNRSSGTDDQVSNMSVVLFEDVAGTPGKILAYNKPAVTSILMDAAAGATGDGTPRWLAVPISYWLPAGDYWLGFASLANTNTIIEVYKDGSGADRTYVTGGDWFADWGFYTPTTTTDRYSLRGNIIR